MSEINLDDFPDLSEDYIEQQAEDLLRRYSSSTGTETSPPISAELIAEQLLGYEIEITDEGLFSDPDYLGGIVFEDAVIKVNSSVEAHEGRYNFTIAHEIGHHVLHKQFYLDNRNENTGNIICRETGSKPLVEQQADRFAAALLMPDALVRDAYSRTLKSHPKLSSKKTLRALRAFAAAVLKAGEFTNVSNTAMVNRLIDLRLVSGAKYQTGTPQDFYRREGYPRTGSISQTLRWVTYMLLHPLRTLKQLRKYRK